MEPLKPDSPSVLNNPFGTHKYRFPLVKSYWHSFNFGGVPFRFRLRFSFRFIFVFVSVFVFVSRLHPPFLSSPFVRILFPRFSVSFFLRKPRFRLGLFASSVFTAFATVCQGSALAPFALFLSSSFHPFPTLPFVHPIMWVFYSFKEPCFKNHVAKIRHFAKFYGRSDTLRAERGHL